MHITTASIYNILEARSSEQLSTTRKTLEDDISGRHAPVNCSAGGY